MKEKQGEKNMQKQDIVIVRYGHRDVRDYRVTGHCALVSRALGAKEIIICGNPDENLNKTIKEVNTHWGGKFGIKYTDSWRKTITNLKKKGYTIIHLTMYGIPIQEVEEKINKKNKIAIIIGSQKVERAVYDESDYNIGITNQPHSEIAALAVFLDRIQKGKELEKHFLGAKCQIIPQEKGKKVINN